MTAPPAESQDARDTTASRQLEEAFVELVAAFLLPLRTDASLRATVHALALRIAELTREASAPSPAPPTAVGPAEPAGGPQGLAPAADVTAGLPAAPVVGEASAEEPPREEDTTSLAERMARVVAERDREWRTRPAQALATGPAEVASDVHPVETLGWLEVQARVAADAARWAGERQTHLARGVDWTREIAPGDREIIERARAAGLYAWMCRPDAPVISDPGGWHELGGVYEAVADALGYARLVLDQPDADERLGHAFALLAEAQNALRVAVERFGEREDPLQKEVFRWLRTETLTRRIYVARFMRLADRADPSGWGELRARIQREEETLRAELDVERRQRKLWGNVRYRIGRLAEADAPDRAARWAAALATVDELVASGVPPSRVELRDALLPHVEDLPDDIEPGPHALRVLREIDRYLAAHDAEDAARGRASAEVLAPDPVRERVAALLRGRAMVLIGGIRRQKHAAAIEEAFGLSELVWLDGGVDSIATFEPAVARDDVAVVVLMIRWSSHGYGDVKDFCDAHGKPLVRLPAGYNPNQLAHQILEQAGERLAERSGEV